MAKHTNRVKVLGPLLMISYSDLDGARVAYPSVQQESFLLNAAERAREIMRGAVAEMDRVVFFRRPEGEPFTSIMNYHFGLAPLRAVGLQSNVVDKSFSLGDVGATDRRTVLNKIRMGMLSISFHLNTGVYLIDTDNDERTIKVGVGGGVKGQTSVVNFLQDGRVAGFEEGYVSHRGQGRPHAGLLSGFKNGEIHISFKYLHSMGYTASEAARVIIHEAAHKYWGVADQAYAHNVATYSQLGYLAALDNADSFAWTALSLDAKGLIRAHSSQGNPVEPQGARYP